MDLRLLQTFVAAVENENFTRAAESLGITQAAVSKHVANLEKELGVALFVRKGRSSAATNAARCLYGYARQILELVEKARQELGVLPAHLSGTLRIAASSVPAEWLLPELLAGLRSELPGVQVLVSVSDSKGATSEVLNGRVDVGLVGELPGNSELTARPVGKDELVLIVGAGHQLVRSDIVALDQLRELPLILREAGSGSRHCVEQHLAAAGLTPGELNVVMEVNSNESIRHAVERHAGIAFQSRRAIQDDVQAGRIVPIMIDGMSMLRTLYAIFDKRRAPTPAMRAFLDFLDRQGQLSG